METIPIDQLPVWAVVLDTICGFVMWTLIGRAAMRFFLPADSPFFFNRIFIKLTDPLIAAFKWVTPPFLVDELRPLYVAWFFYLGRFYLLPWLLGYSVFGMLAFPLEGEIAAFVYKIFSPGW